MLNAAASVAALIYAGDQEERFWQSHDDWRSPATLILRPSLRSRSRGERGEEAAAVSTLQVNFIAAAVFDIESFSRWPS